MQGLPRAGDLGEGLIRVENLAAAAGRTPLPVIACSLDAGDLAERKAYIEKTVSKWMLSHTRSGQTLHIRFVDDPEAHSALEHIIELESRCCPFFSFELRRAADAIFLSVGVPAGAEAVLDDLISV